MSASLPAPGSHGAWIFVLSWPPDAVGGVNEVVFAMASQVQKRGYVPIIAVAGWDTGSGPSHIRGIEVVSLRLRQPISTTPPFRWLPGAARTLVPDSRALLRLVRTRKAVVWNPHFPSLECAIPVWLRRLALLGAPILASFHGLDVKELKSTTGSARRLWHMILRHVDGVVAVSEAMKNEIAAFEPKARIAVIRNGVAASEFLPPSPPADAPVTILHIGKFEHKKGQDILLPVFRNLLDDGINARLILVGAQGPKLEETRSMVAELGLAAHVSLHLNVPHDRIPEFFAQASVFVLPSRAEGLPLALLEAGAVGIPVIATAVGGVPEVLTDGDTGLLIPPEDPDSLEKALRRLLSDPDLRERLRQNMRRDILARWTWDVAGAQYCELLASVGS